MKRLSCICLPDQEASRAIRKLMLKISKEASSKKALAFIPHFTIRGDFKIKEKDLRNLVKELNIICKEVGELELKLTNCGFYPWKIIFLDIEKTDNLQIFHNKCMDVINKYRTNWIPEMLDKNKSFKGKQLKYIKKYGYHFAYEFYSPHFTLAGNDIEDEVFETLKAKLKLKKAQINLTAEYLSLIDRDRDNESIIDIKLGD